MSTPTLSIAAVSALTGLAKEVLRKWEVRYGFPVPVRDAIGHRRFSQEQVVRLQLIKVLLDGGMRARNVVPLPVAQLQAACASMAPAVASALSDSEVHHLIAALQADDPQVIHAFLDARLAALGLRDFVVEQVPSINTLVGLAWADGRIGVRNEHLYTESIKAILRREIAALTISRAPPRILLTTAPGEAHTLGLLMVEAILGLEGADCVPLGAQLGAAEIVLAASQYQVDIIALSFSDSFPVKKAFSFLKQLRLDVPASISIWAGGAGVLRLQEAIPGIELITSIARVAGAVASVRNRRGIIDNAASQ